MIRYSLFEGRVVALMVPGESYQPVEIRWEGDMELIENAKFLIRQQLGPYGRTVNPDMASPEALNYVLMGELIGVLGAEQLEGIKPQLISNDGLVI